MNLETRNTKAEALLAFEVFFSHHSFCFKESVLEGEIAQTAEQDRAWPFFSGDYFWEEKCRQILQKER